MGLHGKSSTFVIGGSLGLSEEVLKRADEKLSFFKNDLSASSLMRVILANRFTRSYRIIHGGTRIINRDIC